MYLVGQHTQQSRYQHMCPMARFWLLLLVVCGASLSRAESPIAISSGNDITSKPLRTVCTVFWEGMEECDETKPPETYTGYELELFRRTASYLAETFGQSEWLAENYTFLCTSYDFMWADVIKTTPDRVCDVGVAGISVTMDALAQGYKFTRPSFESGRGIMVYASNKVDMFLFLKPFDQWVWICTFATTVVVGIAVLFAEVPAGKLLSAPKPSLNKYLNLQWASTAMLLQAMQQFSARSAGARIIILGYAFLVLILINAYIAVLSSQLTVQSINMNIHGISDLLSKPVGVFEGDAKTFKKYNLQYIIPMPWNDAQDEANMLEALRNGTVTALVMDVPFVEYKSATNCDMYVVGETIMPVSYGFAFPPDTSLEYMDLWNQGLVNAEETGLMTDLENQYIKPAGACPSKSGNLATAQLTMPQLAGLWVFLAVACAGGYSLNFVTWCWKKFRDYMGWQELGSSHGSMNGRNQILPSTGSGSIGGLAGSRSMSLLKAQPGLDWLTVADASTTEEAMELLEAHLKNMDKKLKTLTLNLDSKFNMLNENLFGGPTKYHDDPTEEKGPLPPGMEALPGLAYSRSRKGSEDVTAKVASRTGSERHNVAFGPRSVSFLGRSDDEHVEAPQVRKEPGFGLQSALKSEKSDRSDKDENGVETIQLG